MCSKLSIAIDDNMWRLSLYLILQTEKLADPDLATSLL